jgi:hypothetical protein
MLALLWIGFALAFSLATSNERYQIFASVSHHDGLGMKYSHLLLGRGNLCVSEKHYKLQNKI